MHILSCCSCHTCVCRAGHCQHVHAAPRPARVADAGRARARRHHLAEPWVSRTSNNKLHAELASCHGMPFSTGRSRPQSLSNLRCVPHEGILLCLLVLASGSSARRFRICSTSPSACGMAATGSAHAGGGGGSGSSGQQRPGWCSLRWYPSTCPSSPPSRRCCRCSPAALCLLCSLVLYMVRERAAQNQLKSIIGLTTFRTVCQHLPC